jgi:hypothetical protein
MYDCSRWYALEHLPRILRVQNFSGWLIRYHWVPLTLLGFVLPAVGGRPLVPWGIFLRVTLGLHAISGSSTLQPICGDSAQNLLAPAHYFALREAVTRTELTRRKSSALRCFQRGGNGMAMQFTALPRQLASDLSKGRQVIAVDLQAPWTHHRHRPPYKLSGNGGLHDRADSLFSKSRKADVVGYAVGGEVASRSQNELFCTVFAKGNERIYSWLQRQVDRQTRWPTCITGRAWQDKVVRGHCRMFTRIHRGGSPSRKESPSSGPASMACLRVGQLLQHATV